MIFSADLGLDRPLDTTPAMIRNTVSPVPRPGMGELTGQVSCRTLDLQAGSLLHGGRFPIPLTLDMIKDSRLHFLRVCIFLSVIFTVKTT